MKLHPDELAVLVHMKHAGQAFDVAAAAIGVHPKRAARIYWRWVPWGWLDDDRRLQGKGWQTARAVTAGLEARLTGGQKLEQVIAELVSRRQCNTPVAADMKPNARDLVGAALCDIDWRLERGRRQRQRPTRRQLREARWLLQQAMAVLSGELGEGDYRSPRRGLHKHDLEGAAFTETPPEMPATDRTRGAGELYRRTMGGMR